MQNYTQFLITFVNIFFDAISFAIVARVIISWFRTPINGKIHQIIVDITDPILNPIKKITPRIGMLDISPIIAMFALDFIRSGLVYLLSNM